MSRVADLLEDWSKDPAYIHDFAALARELQMRCAADMAAGPSPPRRTEAVTAPRDPVEQRPRKKAKSV